MGSFTLKLKLAQRELNYDHAFIVLPAAIVWWGNSVEPCAVCHCLDSVQQIQLYSNESFVECDEIHRAVSHTPVPTP